MVAVGAVLIALTAIEDDNVVSVGSASAFYDAPNPVPAGPAGTLLRSEPRAIASAIGAPAGTRARRVLYLSKSSNNGDEPIVVSGTVYVPPGAAPAAGRPVLAWAHGTSGVASNCAPSLNSNPTPTMVPALGAFLRRGWVVAASDYPGLGTAGPAAYLDGVMEGRAVLDSVRAAQQLPISDAGNKTIIWGHSQGGHAALFAGEIGASYAPELKLLGVATAAPAVELARLAALDAGTIVGQVLGSFLLWSWPRTQPGLSLEAIAGQGAGKLINAVAARCLAGDKSLIEELALAGVEQVSKLISVTELLTNPGWARELKENTPPASASGPPLLIAQGTADTIIPPQTTYNYFLRLCAAGRAANELRMAGVDHIGAGLAAAPAVIAWATARLAGSPVTSDCVKEQKAAL